MKLLRLVPLLVLAACASGGERAALLNSLLGQPDTEAVRVLGVPSRVYEASGHRYLAYTEQRATVIGGGGPFFGGYGTGFGYGPGPGFGYGGGFAFGGLGAFPAEIVPRICETTLDVVEGRIASWALRGDACG